MQDQQNNPGNGENQVPPQGMPPLAPQPPVVQPQPTPQGDYLHPIVDTPKHSYHPKRVIIALSAAVAISLIVVAVLVIIAIMPQRDNATTSKTSTPATSTGKETLTAEQTLKHINETMKDAAAAQQAITLPVKAPKKSFYTIIPDAAPTQGLAVVVADSKTKDQLDAIAKSFTKDSFTTKSIRELANATGFLSYYIRDDVICQATATPTDATTKARKVEVDCLDIARYSEYADAQQPLVSVYTPAATASVDVAFTGKPTATTSATAGYSLVDIPVSTVISQQVTSYGTLAAFYQSPDSLWHYFLDHDSTILVECSKYNTTALLYAYAGKPCLNNKTAAQDVVVAPKKKQ